MFTGSVLVRLNLLIKLSIISFSAHLKKGLNSFSFANVVGIEGISLA